MMRASLSFLASFIEGVVLYAFEVMIAPRGWHQLFDAVHMFGHGDSYGPTKTSPPEKKEVDDQHFVFLEGFS